MAKREVVVGGIGVVGVQEGVAGPDSCAGWPGRWSWSWWVVKEVVVARKIVVGGQRGGRGPDGGGRGLDDGGRGPDGRSGWPGRR